MLLKNTFNKSCGIETRRCCPVSINTIEDTAANTRNATILGKFYAVENQFYLNVQVEHTG